jgi:nucleotide-binding universal stress UspA family protein
MAACPAPGAKILVPVVDSVNALPAARHLAREFRNGERFEVHLLHVRSAFSLRFECFLTGERPDTLLRSSAAEALRPVRGIFDACHIGYAVHLGSGEAGALVEAAARELAVTRIVMGTARSWSATRMAEDAVIQRLLDDAPAPVTLVAGKATSSTERLGVAVGLGATFWLLLEAGTA